MIARQFGLLLLGSSVGWYSAHCAYRWRMLRFLRVDKPQLQRLKEIALPMLVTSAKGRILWDNCRAAPPTEAAGGMRLPAVDLSMLAARSCCNGFGSEEIRIDGRAWLLLALPFLCPDSLFTDKPQRLLCLINLDAGQAADDRNALQHIAHDLRAPLVSILNLIELRSLTSGEEAENSEAPEAPEVHSQELEFLAELRRQAEYSLRISRDFLQFSRAEQLDYSSFSTFNLEDIVLEAIDYLWLNANQKSIQLTEPQCTFGNTSVRGSAAKLIRAIVNILDNAIKYSPPGSTVFTQVLQHHDKWLLRVTDQGEGIHAEDLPFVFEPMFQSAKHRGLRQGVGLGLSFVKLVVERHGGEVAIESQPGHGTQLSVLLPRA